MRSLDDMTSSQERWRRECDAMTLPEVWSIVHRAWLARRRHPWAWRLITNNVHMLDVIAGPRHAPLGLIP